LDAENRVYLTGIFEQTVDFDPGTGIFKLNSTGGGDLFLSRLDAMGEFSFAQSAGGSTGDEEALGIAVGPSGNISITGVYFSDQADLDPTDGTACVSLGIHLVS